MYRVPDPVDVCMQVCASLCEGLFLPLPPSFSTISFLAIRKILKQQQQLYFYSRCKAFERTFVFFHVEKAALPASTRTTINILHEESPFRDTASQPDNLRNKAAQAASKISCERLYIRTYIRTCRLANTRPNPTTGLLA